MNRIPVFVGLDYHQDAVQVCVMDGGGKVLGNLACDNDPRRAANYVAAHGSVGGAAMECCEGAADFAEGQLCGAEFPPRPAMASSNGSWA